MAMNKVICERECEEYQQAFDCSECPYNQYEDYTVERLAAISKTSQHEEIEKMLTYYNVKGIIELTEEQISEYVKRRIGE